MATVKETIVLNITAEKVWPFFFDIDKIYKWRTDIHKFEWFDGIPQKGLRFFIELEIKDKIRRFDCIITNFKMNRFLAFEGSSVGFAKLTSVWEIVPEGNGCKFTITETLEDRLHSKFFKFFFDKLFLQKMLLNTVKSSLDNLQCLVEGEGQ